MTALYLDWNATTPPHPDVLAAMREAAATAWANPSSVHAAGRAARARVEDAREAVAALLGFDARDVVLASGGTEANNLGLVRPFVGADGGWLRGTLVTSRLEHPSVTAVAESLARRGVDVAWLPVAPSGHVDPADVRAALASASPGPRLVAVQAVNQETGAVQPVASVADAAHAHGALLHVDAVQAAGRVDPALWSAADSVVVTAHKLRGPKGIGALAVRPGAEVRPILRGGAQERGLRPGTLDAVAAAGLAVAARLARSSVAAWSALAPLRDRLASELVARAASLSVRATPNGEGPRAPHVANLSFDGFPADELAAALDLEGVAVSAGSACAAGTHEPSPVVTAMLGHARATTAIRLSLGPDATPADVDRAVEAVSRVLARPRR